MSSDSRAERRIEIPADSVPDPPSTVQPAGAQGTAPAQRFVLPDGTRLGVISSVTEPFCSACDRARLTADGFLYLCLYANESTNLGQLLRQETTDEILRHTIRTVWQARTDRSAEERLGDPYRGALYQVEELKNEMESSDENSVSLTKELL